MSEVVRRLRERILGRITMNQNNADIHPDPQAQYESKERVAAYKNVLSDLDYIEKEYEKESRCLCDARGQPECPVHTKGRT